MAPSVGEGPRRTRLRGRWCRAFPEGGEIEMSDTEHYPGSLYPRENFLLGWFVRKALSRVAFADEQADAIRGLAREGAVVHAVRAESQLNRPLIHI